MHDITGLSIIILISIIVLLLICNREQQGHANDLARSTCTCTFVGISSAVAIPPVGIPPVAVLFTMYNVEERDIQTNRVIDYYADIIPKECTFLVDSANRGVSEYKVPGAQQARFEQESACVISRKDATIGPTLKELCSLEYALDTLDFGNAAHVIKLTTKYCIPQFYCDVLHNIDQDADIIVQDARNFWQRNNTEIFGFRLQIAKEIIRHLKAQPNDLHNDLERRVHALIQSGKYKVQRLPRLQLSEPLIPRNDGSVLSSLFTAIQT